MSVFPVFRVVAYASNLYKYGRPNSDIYTHDLEQRNSENGQWNQRRTDGTW